MPIDKDKLYGEYNKSQELNRQIVRKALDIPDDMNVTQIKNGWGWKEMAALVAGGYIGLAGYALATREPPAIPPSPAPAVAAGHQDLDTNTHRSVVIKPRRPSQ